MGSPQRERFSLDLSDEDDDMGVVTDEGFDYDTEMLDVGQDGSLIWHTLKKLDNGTELMGRVQTFNCLFVEPDPVKGFDLSQSSYDVVWKLPDGTLQKEILSKAKVIEYDITPGAQPAAAVAPVAPAAARAASVITVSSGRDPPRPAQPAADQPAGSPLPTSSARVQLKPSQAEPRGRGRKQSAPERVGRPELLAAAAKAAASSETVSLQDTSARRGRDSVGGSSGAGTPAVGAAENSKKSPSKSNKKKLSQQKLAKAKGPPYPRSVSFTPGDKPLNVWINEPMDDSDDEFVVEAIVDERLKGKKQQYLVKWKGYELKPDDWNDREGLEDCVALDVWEAKQKSSS